MKLRCVNHALNGTSSSISVSSITLTPSYSVCTMGEQEIPDSSVRMGGCSYVYYANGKFDIAGATCASSPITIERPGCVLTIGPQSGLSGNLAYANEGSGKLRKVSISGAAEGFTYTFTGVGCPAQGTFTGGTIRGTSTLSATNSGGQAQGISIE